MLKSLQMTRWLAYVDESMRQRHDGTGVYVLAAALVDPDSADQHRDVLRQIRRGRPFHWRLGEPADQRKAVATVAGLESLHLVAVGTRLDSRRQERARRLCLEQLLWRLEGCGVEHVWLDARTQSLNKRDMTLVDLLRARDVISQALRVDFAHPFNGRDGEILLWLPDIVAGAVATARGDGDLQFIAPLEAVIEEFIIELR